MHLWRGPDDVLADERFSCHRPPAGLLRAKSGSCDLSIRDGSLRIVLSDWSPVEPAMYLYYPGHRRIPQGLRELIDVLREEIASESHVENIKAALT